MERGERLRELHMQMWRGIKRTRCKEQGGQGTAGLERSGEKGVLRGRPHPHLLCYCH